MRKLSTNEDTGGTGGRSRRELILGVVCVLCGGAFPSGCGYSLAGRGSFLPAYIRTIGVPAFVNRTTIFNLETMMTQKVRAEFIGRGKYQILPQDTGVDAVLVGEVTSVSVVPAAFSAQQIATRYALTMVASIQLKDMRENKVLWENPSLLFRQEYEATGGRSVNDPVAFFQQDVNALDRITTDFSRSIVSAILEAF